MCPSNNPPFVLSKIQLSSLPEYVYRTLTLFGLSRPGTTVSFQLEIAQIINHHRQRFI
jgi:hypothetical protein